MCTALCAAQASKPAAPATQKASAPAAAPAQKSAAPTPVNSQVTDAAASIPDSATVITLTGYCTPGATAPCTKTITKGEFEKVAKAVNPNLPTDARRRLAAYYIQLLAMSNEAKKDSLEKDPSFDERVLLSTLQLLATAKSEKLAEGTQATPAEIESFYNDNSDLFQQVSLRRIIIPKTTDKNVVSAEELKKIADAAQASCAAGTDTDKVQAEVWLKATLPGTPVNTNFGWRSRGELLQQQLPQDLTQGILALKSGETSKLLEDQGYYYIF